MFAKWLTYQAMMKLEGFHKVGTHGKCNFENKFLEMVFQFLEKIIVY